MQQAKALHLTGGDGLFELAISKPAHEVGEIAHDPGLAGGLADAGEFRRAGEKTGGDKNRGCHGGKQN